MADAATGLQPAATFRVWILEVRPSKENPDGIVVVPDQFRVSKEKDTSSLQVEWICPSNAFRVEFKDDKSPFLHPRFPSLPRGEMFVAHSGAVRDDVDGDDHLTEDKRKNYRYTVKIGDRVLDPGGVVNA